MIIKWLLLSAEPFPLTLNCGLQRVHSFTVNRKNAEAQVFVLRRPIRRAAGIGDHEENVLNLLILE
jgi:hypothetical protein